MTEPSKAVQPPVRTPLRQDSEIVPGIRNAKVTITKAGWCDYRVVLTYEAKLPAYFGLEDKDRWATYTWSDRQILGRERARSKGFDMMRRFMIEKTAKPEEPMVIYPNDVCP